MRLLRLLAGLLWRVDERRELASHKAQFTEVRHSSQFLDERTLDTAYFESWFNRPSAPNPRRLV